MNLTTNIISLYAGTYGSTGSSGDGGPYQSALYDNLGRIALDQVNNLMYIVDTNRIRMINRTSGIVSAFAGTGSCGTFTGPGVATSVRFQCSLLYVAVDNNNNRVFIADHCKLY